MSVYVHDHLNLRVTRTACGVTQQHYFPHHQLAEAEAKDAELAEWQEKMRRRHGCNLNGADRVIPEADGYYIPERWTGIQGLTLCFYILDKRCSSNAPMIMLQAKDARSGNFRSVRRAISKRSGNTIYGAWRELCQMLATFRGFDTVPLAWYRAEPSPEQFKALREHYVAKGYDIPFAVLGHLIETAD